MMTRWSFIAFVFFAAAIQAQDVYVNADGEECGMDGTATSDKHKALNRLKNRWVFPTEADIDANVTLAAMLEPGEDHERWSTARAARISGWVVKVKGSGGESCNCGMTKSLDTDTHIDIALTPDADKTECVVVEVTPRIRKMMADQGIDWRSSLLKNEENGILGRYVEFTGWLFFDSMHVGQAANTSTGSGQIHRATAWELHPVTSMRFAEPPPIADPAGAAPRALRADARRRIVADPNRVARLRAKNEEVLAGFDPAELEAEAKDLRIDIPDDEPALLPPQPAPFVVLPSPVPCPWVIQVPCEPRPTRNFGCRPFKFQRQRCRR
jgi:hypothetical protein